MVDIVVRECDVDFFVVQLCVQLQGGCQCIGFCVFGYVVGGDEGQFYGVYYFVIGYCNDFVDFGEYYVQ